MLAARRLPKAKNRVKCLLEPSDRSQHIKGSTVPDKEVGVPVV